MISDEENQYNVHEVTDDDLSCGMMAFVSKLCPFDNLHWEADGCITGLLFKNVKYKLRRGCVVPCDWKKIFSTLELEKIHLN